MKKKILSLITALVMAVGLIGVMPTVSAGAYDHISYNTTELYQQYDKGCNICSIAVVALWSGQLTNASTAQSQVYKDNGYTVSVYFSTLDKYQLARDNNSISVSKIYNYLQKGPVIIGNSSHYSVVVGYNGSTSSLSYSGFIVQDTKNIHGGSYRTNLSNWISKSGSVTTLRYYTGSKPTTPTPHTHSYTDTYYPPTESSQGYTLHKCSCGDTYKDSYTTLGEFKDLDSTLYNGHLYVLVQADNLSWASAKQYSEKLNGYMVAITSKEENDVVQKLFVDNNISEAYLGGIRGVNGNNSAFRWVDKSGESFSYKNWATGEPNDTKYINIEDGYGVTKNGENYVSMLSSGYWNDNRGYKNNINTFVLELTPCYFAYDSNEYHIGQQFKDITQYVAYNTGNYLEVYSMSNYSVSGFDPYKIGTQTVTLNYYGIEVKSIATVTDHNYKGSVIAPTCTSQGYTLYRCTKCGNSYKSNYTNKTNHTYGKWITVTSPTCTKSGVKARSCTGCGVGQTSTISALGHNYKKTTTKPTATSVGYTVHKCSRCNSKYTDTYKFTKISGFKTSSVSESSVKLKWNKVSGATGYIISKYDTSKKKWVKVATTTSSSYTVKKLSSGKSYKFSVKPYKTVNGKDVTGSEYPTVTAITKLPTVVNGRTSIGRNSVKLTWKKTTGAQGYIVYKYNNAKKTWVRVAKTKSLNYTVKKLKAKTNYKFAVKAYKYVNKKEITSVSFKTISVKTKE